MLAVQIILDSDDYVIAGDMNVFTGQTHRPTLVADDEDSYNGMPLWGGFVDTAPHSGGHIPKTQIFGA